MAKKPQTTIAMGLFGITVTGCGVPQPPQKVNAYLSKNMPVVGAGPEACDKADTLLPAKCE